MITGGTAESPNPVSPGPISLGIVLGPPGTMTVQYAAICNGEYESPLSEPTQVQIN